MRVAVRSVYVRQRSDPARGAYLYAYRVRIANEGRRCVQLLSRHWAITNAHGRTEHVRWVEHRGWWD